MWKMKEPDFEKNGFDLIRYLAAISVMMLHYASYSMILSDQAGVFMDKVRYTALLFPGVVMLFALSGFLAPASMERAGTGKVFYRRRFFRIYPELWGCTLVNLVVVGVLVPELLDGTIVFWLGTQVFGIANTPSCLKPFATGSINGPLWTIFIEVQFYLLMGLFYQILKRLKNYQWVLLLAGCAAGNLLCEAMAGHWGGIVSKVIERFFLPYALWFLIGVLCYQKRQRLLFILQRAFLPLLAVYLLLARLPVTVPGYYTNMTIGILLPFLVIGCGYLLPGFRLRCDLSYEMFLYHWIVLNVIVHFDLLNRLPWYVCLAVFFFATIVLSWLSWQFVRKPAERLGKKLKKA